MDAPIIRPDRTIWHLTFGTFGSRLHGDKRPTVDRQHNQPGAPFIQEDAGRHDFAEGRMSTGPVRLDLPQRLFVEAELPGICERGGWGYLLGAAPGPPENHHVHVLLDADPAKHGKDVRKWLKRWLGQKLDDAFTRPASGTWWAEGGSTRAVKNDRYLTNAYGYIAGQRSTPEPDEESGAE